jgi:hypothetical protein
VIETLATSSIRRMAYEFEKLQGILYVFEVVNGSHILIIASPINPTSYYCERDHIQLYYMVWLMQNVSFGTMIFNGLTVAMIRQYCSKIRHW